MRKIAKMMIVTGIVTVIGGGSAFAGTNDPGIQEREQNQEKRIDQGIKSGQLTPGEAGRLETQQAKIKQDEERMKADGNLTGKERAKLTREQNRASRNIYRKKHNDRTANVQ
jgi:hypothetical protein